MTRQADALRVIRRQAINSVAMVASRSIVVQLLAGGASIVLAHSLSPGDVGVLAVGLGITGFASVVADGGLAAGLIRARTEPSKRELELALGLQLAAMLALAALCICAVAPFGRIALVTALMLVALPLTSLQTPPKVLLERALDYRRVVIAEVTASFVFFCVVSMTLFLGANVWGVAAACIARETAASAVLLLTVPAARLRPSFDLADFRRLIDFGAKYQAVNVANLIRDQGLNVAVAAVLGLPALGIWALAARVLQVPLVLFAAVWRVSYPVMARIVGVDSRPRDLIERGVVLSGLCIGGALSIAIASAPQVIPLVFGSRWTDAANVVAPALFALTIGGPVSIATGGYLYATDGAGVVLISTVLHTLAWFAVAVPLMLVVGVPAIGIGLIAGALVDAIVLGKAASRASGAHVLGKLWPTSLAATVASCAGWLVAGASATTPFAAVEAGTTALVAFVIAMAVLGWVFLRPELTPAITWANRVIRAKGGVGRQLGPDPR